MTIERTAPPADDRSASEHRFFFACLGYAFDNWPERHDCAPFADADNHLRAFLLCHDQVLHCETIDLMGRDVDALCGEGPAEGLTDAIRFYSGAITQHREAGGHSFLRAKPGGGLSLRVPRTIRFVKNGGLSRARFREIAEKVYLAIYHEAGIEVEDLKKEARRACAPSGGFRKG